MKSTLQRYFILILDKMLSIMALIIVSPFLGLIALAIKITSQGPIFFIQERAGLKGKLFRIYKFRTMVVDAEKKGAGVFVEENDARITTVGKFLRRTSLDELPQLINILKGEMRFVGPRPTLPYQLEKYSERQKRRLEVKPGVTGWAQVNGRSTLTWPERIELDLWYIDNWSLWLDLIIIVKTVKVTVCGGNLYKTALYDPVSGEFKKNSDENNNNES